MGATENTLIRGCHKPSFDLTTMNASLNNLHMPINETFVVDGQGVMINAFQSYEFGFVFQLNDENWQKQSKQNMRG